MKIILIIPIILGISNACLCQTKALNFLEGFMSDDDSAYVSIFADGNLQGILSDNEGNSNAIATGALGISVLKTDALWIASINIASTADTISSDFGNIVLNPAVGGALRSGLLEYYKNEIWSTPFGIHTYISASSGRWRANDTTATVSILGWGLTVVHEVINSKKGDNSVYLGFEAGLAYRGILGDFSNRETLYSSAIGTTGNHFLGLEGGLKIRFNKISAGLQGFWLFDIEEKNNIDGVTSFQLTGGITISGPIFQEKFKL